MTIWFWVTTGIIAGLVVGLAVYAFCQVCALYITKPDEREAELARHRTNGK